MKDKLEIYRTWAPAGSLWSEWAKPVLFAAIPDQFIGTKIHIPALEWLTECRRNTMVIVDMPGIQSVAEGVALAWLGYRPVPLFNGVVGPGDTSLVDVNELMRALCAGEEELQYATIRPDAPPAFLLDVRRMRAHGNRPGTFDNRWCVFPQDMPSADCLLRHGIERVILRSDTVENDLAHVLCRYSAKNIKLFLVEPNNTIRPISVKRPSRFKALTYRFRTILGLHRNATGGFGGAIPDPTQAETIDSAGGVYIGSGSSFRISRAG